VENPVGKSIRGVDTEAVLADTLAAMDSLEKGFICVNVQETDLAGHREDPKLYGERLVLADRGLSRIMEKMADEDFLVVTADHGNDPVIGHPQHTREKTPILVWRPSMASGLPGRHRPGFDVPGRHVSGCDVPGGLFIGERGTLADTGATVCDYFHAPPPESGNSYLGNCRGGIDGTERI